MIPVVKQLTSFDVYRDGGSISASFKNTEGTEFSLFFGVKLISRGPGNIETTGFRSPILETYNKTIYKSPVTGVSSSDWVKEEIPITWKEALQILYLIKPQVEKFESDYLWVYDRMIEVANNEGK